MPLRTAAGIEANGDEAAAAGATADLAATAPIVAVTPPQERTEPITAADPARSDPARSEPARTEPARTERVVPDPARSEIAELRAENDALAAELAELRTGYRAIAGHTRLRAAGITESTSFRVEADGPDNARAGVLTTPRGEIATPAYVPVAGRGAIAGITPDEMIRLGARALTVDLHEMYLQPGPEVIEGLGGIGAAMAWPAPVFGDTGVGAIGRQKRTRVTDEGIAFRGRLDGSPHDWDPERAVRIAHRMGVDVAFALADPVDPAKPRSAQQAGVGRTGAWARRALIEHAWQTADRHNSVSLWATVTGGADPDLRRAAAVALRTASEHDRQEGGLGFGGYRIEGADGAARAHLLRAAVGELEADRPRYLAGVSDPADLFAAIDAGIDLIDGTGPAVAGAAGTVFTTRGIVDLTDPVHRTDFRPLDPDARWQGVPNRADEFTRAYVHHLFAANEGLAVTLCTLHNEHFFVALAAAARRAMAHGGYPGFATSFLRGFGTV
nr:tRNA-guanine transglycosylase [Tsukamurella sp. 1534]